MTPYINVHTHKTVENNTIGIFNLLYDGMSNYNNCSFGIHPWDLGNQPVKDYLIKLEKYCIDGKIVAIGEIGIDRSINHPIDKQVIVFKQQQVLADKYKLPIIVHCVRAWSDLIELRIILKPKTPWVFHGYNGNLIVAKQLLSIGCYLSFGHQLLDNKKVQDVFRQLPLDRVFLETDNSCEKIEHIFVGAANLHGISIDKLKCQIKDNFERIFRNKYTLVIYRDNVKE